MNVSGMAVEVVTFCCCVMDDSRGAVCSMAADMGVCVKQRSGHESLLAEEIALIDIH